MIENKCENSSSTTVHYADSSMMHKVFGIKQEVTYYDRKGAYIIPFQKDKVAVIQTPKGFFLLGGGIEQQETDEECIKRECLEESGYDVHVGAYVCSAETYGNHYSNHPWIEFFHPIQKYYTGELLEKIQLPTEKDHTLVWIPYEDLRGKLYVEMQNWALDTCWADTERNNE